MLHLIFLSSLLAASPGTLKVRVLDADHKTVTAARVNVIGPDNAFYEPAQNPLAEYSLKRKGNRGNVSPLRYFGAFFYTDGTFELQLPPGVSRIEVSKGYSYYTSLGEVRVEDGKTVNYEVVLQRVIDMPRYGWHSTDTHLHFDRSDAAADGPILQLLSAEDIEMGHILTRESAKGYGVDSLNSSGRYSIVSGREVTSAGLGHVNQLMYKRLAPAVPGVPLATLYDQVVADGGAMQHDHAGYGQEIYADAVLGKSDAVELLQFGLYRPEIGLDGYYLLLNSGFRYPLLGASDYPVCRTMSDSRTFVADSPKSSFPTAVGRLLRGQAFATSSPLLFLSVNGKGPGSDIEYPGNSAQTVTVEVQAVSGDLPFNSVEILQDGKVVNEWHGPDAVFRKELKATLRLSESSWIAARCSGPDTVHAHTNPVWIYFNGRAPFKPEAAKELLDRIRAYENTKISDEVKNVAKSAEAKVVASPRPAPVQRFPVTTSDTTLFPPVLPRPKALQPVTMEGSIIDKSGQPLGGVDVSVRGTGSPVRTDGSGRFVLSHVDENSALFLRLSKQGYATTNTTYLNPRSPKENLRFVLVTSAELADLVRGAPQSRGATAIVLIGSKVSGLTFHSSPQVQGSPGVGTTRFRPVDPATGFAAVGITQISFQPSSPSLKNDHEPNVIISASPSGKDMVMPVFVDQVTYAPM
jgi:hypothetical protein